MAFTCEKARNQLNLKTVMKQDISVKCFGNNEKMKKKKARSRAVYMKRTNGENLYVSAYVSK